MSAAVKGKKAVPQKAAPKKVIPTKAAPKKAIPTKAAPQKKAAAKKQTVLREPKQVEFLMAGGEVRRKFTMTVQVSGHEYLADPVALVLALTKIPGEDSRGAS